MTKEIIKHNNDTSSVLSDTIQSLAEGLTGISTSSRKDLIFSIGSIFQRLRGGDFLSILLDEWNSYKEKGRVKDDYQATEQHKACLGELLEFLEKDNPDEVRFSTIKQIFLVASEEKHSDRNDVMPLQYIRIARNLESAEIMILNASYQGYKTEQWKETKDDQYWHNYISEHTGLQPKEIIEIYVRKLEDKKLILPPKYADRSGIHVKPYFRLTELGLNFCDYVNSYE